MIPIIKTDARLTDYEVERIRHDLHQWARNPGPLILGPGVDVQFAPRPKPRPFGIVAALAHRSKRRA